MTDRGLKRDIGPVGSALLSFNGIVGAGIFALPATLYLQFGTFSPWLFPLFGALILLIAIPFARLAAMFDTSGGPVAYTAVFGRAASFQVGWLYYVARSAALAANANVFAAYAAALWPVLDGPAGRAAAIVALAAFVTIVNVVGVKRAVRVLDGLSLIKALPLVVLAVGGLIVAGGIPGPGALPEFGALESAALVILYAFIGFENSVVPAGETRDPQRTIPRAMVTTIVLTALLYFVVQLCYVSVMPPGEQPDAPLAALAGQLIGPVGLVILGITALASIAGNFLGAMTSTPRITYALANQGSLPPWFAAVSPRWRTPANSVLFMGLLTTVLALTGSFVWLAVVSTLARLFVYGSSIVALPAQRKRSGQPIGPLLLVAVAGGLAVCLWAGLQSKPESWWMLGGLVAGGLLLYALAARGRSAAAEADVSAIQPPPSSRDPS